MWIPAGALVTAYGVAVLWRELAALSQAGARRLAP
jgi:hypothetical protein